MRRGAFEGEDQADGRRVYRLKWQAVDQTGEGLERLTEKEIRGALFIRYLIGEGKLSEVFS